jgi:hypothetical protein
MTRVSYASIRRLVVEGLRLRVTHLKTGEVIEAEVTGVDKNGYWWRRLDGQEMTFDLVSGIRPKLNDGKTYWVLASGVTIESPTSWSFGWPHLRFEVAA